MTGYSAPVNKLRLLYFLVLSCTGAWLPVFADDLHSRGFSGTRIALVLNVTPFLMCLIQPVYGLLADRIGLRQCMLASLALAALSFLCYLSVHSFWAVLALTACMSVFYNGIQPLLDSLTLGLEQTEKAVDYGSVRVAGAMGWAFTGIAAGYFIDRIDTRVIYLFSSASLLLAFGVAWTLPATDARAALPPASIGRDLRYLLNRHLVFFLLAVTLISASVTTIWNFYSLYMKQIGASASLVGVGLSLQGLFEIPFFFFSVPVMRRLGLKRTFLLCSAAAALRLFLYSQVTAPEWALAVDLLHGLSWSLFWVVCVECTNAFVKPEWRATGQSLLYAAYFGLGAIAGNFWTGFLFERGLPIAAIFLANAGMVGAACLFIALFVRLPVVRTLPQ